MGRENVVEEMLARRGFELKLANPADRLVFPPDLDSALEDELYGMLKKYSFRIFIRDVIKNRLSFTAEDLVRYSTREWVDRYLRFILERGLIEATEGGAAYRLVSEDVFSFGDTLEWFVARVFERELASPALWGVRLGGGRAGGDYDVLASVEGRLVYVEVKSSPPKNVEEGEVAAFLRRTEELRPWLAVFLEDTRLRMKDKIVGIFDGLLEDRALAAERVEDETFTVANRLFITNSRPSMVQNLALCVRKALARDSFWD